MSHRRTTRLEMGLPPKPAPISHVSLRFRTPVGTKVHEGDVDTGQGIIAICGKYALTGHYAETAEPVTCGQCLRSLARLQPDQAPRSRMPLEDAERARAAPNPMGE